MNSRMVLAIVVGGAVLGGMGARAGEAAPGWVVGVAPSAATESKAPVLPQRAGYDVSVEGDALRVRLEVEFVNSSDAVLEGALFLAPLSGVTLDALSYRIGDGEPIEWPTAAKPESASPRAADSRRAAPSARPDAQARAKTPRSEAGRTIVIPAKTSATVDAAFTGSARYVRDRFRLTLPRVCGGVDATATCDGSTELPLAVRVEILHDQPLALVESPTHEILVDFEKDRTVAETVAGARASDAFVLEYTLGEREEAVLTARTGPRAPDGTFEARVLLAPPLAAKRERIRPREVLFILDTSGSMAPPKIDNARQSFVTCLGELRDGDRFNVVTFNNTPALFQTSPVDRTPETIEAARVWLASRQAAGATFLVPALEATLEQQRSESHLRQILVITDGEIQDEPRVRELLDGRLGDSRLFLIGIGSDVKRDVLQRLAEHGRGTAVVAEEVGGLEAIVREMFSEISEPLAWDLRMDWDGAEVLETEPARLPDLYSGRPVSVRARLRGPVPRQIGIRAKTRDGEWLYESRPAAR